MKRFGLRALAEGLMGLSAVAALGACRETPIQPVAVPDANAEIATAATTTILSITFEGYAIGTLGAPWTISRSRASAAQVASTGTTHGKVLVLNGSTTSGEFLIASKGLSSSASQVTSAFDIRPTAGSSFVWSFHGAGSSIGSRRIRLQRVPGSTMLVAQTVPSGSTNCGNLANDVWSRVTLVVRTATFPHTFDVRINGVATACKGVSANISPPFNAMNIMDASNAGYGGIVRFDNILVTTP